MNKSIIKSITKRVISSLLCVIILVIVSFTNNIVVNAEEYDDINSLENHEELLQDDEEYIDENYDYENFDNEDDLEEVVEEENIVSTLESESTLLVSDQKYTGKLSNSSKKRIFKLSLNNDAIIKYSCKFYGTDSHLSPELVIYNSNGNEIFGCASSFSENNIKAGYMTFSHTLCLPKGIYYIELGSGYSSWSSACDYDFTTNIKYPSSTEVYPNGLCSNAQDMDVSKTQYGMLGYDDVRDTYKLHVPADGDVKISINADYVGNDETFMVNVLDSSGKKVSENYVYYNKNFNKFSKDISVFLKKGDYYLQIEREDYSYSYFNANQVVYSFDVTVPKEKHIKGKCQMPYWGEGGGYLIGFETYDNPNNEYYYEMFVMDLTLYAQGLPCWVHRTGMARVPECALWTIWQPQYGYYLTLFRLYDKNGNIIDEDCYGFANAY